MPKGDDTPAAVGRRDPQFMDRYGCLVVLAFLMGTVVSIALAFHLPVLGIPALVTIVGAAALLLRSSAKREREEMAAETERLCGITEPRGNAWRTLFQHEGLEHLIEATAPHVRDAVRLEPATGPSASHIGGVPALPANTAWPRHKGKSMMFLAQVDLDQVKQAYPDSPFPAGGQLLFFVAQPGTWDDWPKEKGFAILHRGHGDPGDVAEPPSDLVAKHRFPRQAVHCVAYEDLPELHTTRDDESDDDADTYFRLWTHLSSGGGETSHKLLGHAQPVQYAMELECELFVNGMTHRDLDTSKGMALKESAKDWRLLLQLDSMPSADMMWGDAGMLYFWIREQDLRADRFDAALVLLQCF